MHFRPRTADEKDLCGARSTCEQGEAHRVREAMLVDMAVTKLRARMLEQAYGLVSGQRS
jgi:hypothetical protein